MENQEQPKNQMPNYGAYKNLQAVSKMPGVGGGLSRRLAVSVGQRLAVALPSLVGATGPVGVAIVIVIGLVVGITFLIVLFASPDFSTPNP